MKSLSDLVMDAHRHGYRPSKEEAADKEPCLSLRRHISRARDMRVKPTITSKTGPEKGARGRP